jgi:hypothetical protein
VTIDWDDEPITFQLRVTGDAAAGYTVEGALSRAGLTHAVAELLFLSSTLGLWRAQEPDGRPRFALLHLDGHERWLASFINAGPVTIPGARAEALMDALAQSGVTPAECPPELVLEAIAEAPRRLLRIRRAHRDRYYRPGSAERLGVQLWVV